LEIIRTESDFDRIAQLETPDLMGMSFKCMCGRKHEVPIRVLRMGESVIDEVYSVARSLGLSGSGLLIHDKIIEDKAIKVFDKLKKNGMRLERKTVGDGKTPPQPEISEAENLAREMGNPDYLISFGSGVISDFVKFAANSLEVPYFLIGSAPSMNGYTSSMAALSEKGIKKTLLVKPADAVFGDTAIFADAPLSMVLAGLGDIISKSVCNADWKLSNLVKGTYFCPIAFRITDKTEPGYLGAAEEIGKKTPSGIHALTDGIMRSGLSMTVIGESTPSSGAEHLLSHYWDLKSYLGKSNKKLHGEQVGVATLIILRLYDYVMNYPIKKKISLRSLKNKYPESPEIEKDLAELFDHYAPIIGEIFFSSKYVPWDEKTREIEMIVDMWDDMCSELEPYVRPYDPVKEAMVRAGAPYTYAHLEKTRDEAIETVLKARYIRGRYTILDLAADLGILESAVEKILE